MLTFILNHLPWFWLALTFAMISAEICTMKLRAVWCAAGSAAALFLSMIPGFSPVLQIICAVSVTTLLWRFCRKPSLRILRQGRSLDFPEKGTFVMQEVTASSDISETSGKITSGDGTFEARSGDDTVIPKGTVCLVTSQEGGMLKVVSVCSRE
jgi:membrane protein implicated in regulation of membrane protease activity